MGEAVAGKQLGRKAMVAGLVAHSLPDIDFLASLWLSTADNLHAHRGFTHSILFVLLISPLLAFIARLVIKKDNLSFRRWWILFLVISGLHIFLDAFNNYGVGWFEPFSDYRISFNSIYVVDPFFSIMPGIAALMLIIIKRGRSFRRFWWITGLTFSFVYLGYCVVNKLIIDKRVERILANKSIPAKRYMTTPAPMQSWLWFIAAETDTGFYTGYVSVFDRRKRNTELYFFPKKENLFQLVNNKEEAQKLVDFSQGYFTFEKHADTILINDLRFGQISGWHDPKQRFAFYYYLQPEMDNTLVVQRGRFANWNKGTFRSFIRRIKGN
jgi:inner membrane protein